MTVWTVSFKDKLKKRIAVRYIENTYPFHCEAFTGCTGPSEAAGKPLSLIPLFFYTTSQGQPSAKGSCSACGNVCPERGGITHYLVRTAEVSESKRLMVLGAHD